MFNSGSLKNMQISQSLIVNDTTIKGQSVAERNAETLIELNKETSSGHLCGRDQQKNVKQTAIGIFKSFSESSDEEADFVEYMSELRLMFQTNIL